MCPADARPTRWTTRTLLDWMVRAFREKGIDSPRLCAEMLLAHVIGCDRLRLYLDTDRPASPLERETLRDLTARALRHEPVQYLVGEAWFFGMAFKVDQRVLIPRPATETLVEHLLHDAKSHGRERGDGLLIADVCTGSGCIAAAIAKNLPQARVLATDLSPGALELAGGNAERHGLSERIELLEGDLLEPLLAHPAVRARRTLDYLAANPPYIADHEWDAVAPNVREHEPTHALRGGRDGLDLVRPLLEGAGALVRPGGLVLVEIADTHGAEAAEIARASGAYGRVDLLRDLEGLDRVVAARVA